MAVENMPRQPAASLSEGMDVSQMSASDLIQWITSRSSVSSAVYVYDDVEQVGFGVLAETWGSLLETAPIIPLQTRAGAGLSLVGRLSEDTSQDAVDGSVLTVYTSPRGLAVMAPSLSFLPPASSGSKLIIQVPAVTPVGEALAFSPTLAYLATTLNLLPENITVLLSATPQESVDFAALSYELDSHAIHVFDHYSSAREIGHELVLRSTARRQMHSLSDTLRYAGYAPLEFAGDKHAHTVLIFPNGPLALYARHIVNRTEGLAMVIVKVLRPWQNDALCEIIPSAVDEIHVFDDVPNDTMQGPLFVDVFASLYDPLRSDRVIRSQRITPDQTQLFIAYPSQFASHILTLVKCSSAGTYIEAPSSSTKLLFFSTPGVNVSSFHQLVRNTFSGAASVRHIVCHDAFSNSGGLTVDRVVFTPKGDAQDFTPLPGIFPLGGNGKADFTCVLEPNLLKSHSVLDDVNPGSSILVLTSWSPGELLANLPSGAATLALQRRLRFYTIDPNSVLSHVPDTTTRDFTGSLVAYLVFLRLYLGRTSSEGLVRKIAQGVAPTTFSSDTFVKLSSRTWLELVQVQLPADLSVVEGKANSTPLKHFEFNAIAVDISESERVYGESKVSCWHEAAKHLLFPSAFAPVLPTLAGSKDEFSPNPLLRPDLPERTYLVTCAVNRRLTPLEYDRNVFHIELNTKGTGLKYAIGEALGVHGWNDEQEVLEFCAWYGVNPDRLITIAVPGGEGRVHTRTIFQALQQQIDLFGKPPKSFYADVAPYATNRADRLTLQFIGSPEGSSTFKKLSEKDTVTFADVLQRYPSARPSIETLCELIGDIKPRHYSIASSQSVVGDRVDLLVVTVEWTSSGKQRHGQCTRYLAGLKVGQKVTVSIKPSVMKLPPDNMQPIIMAGLGTGAAPFRAFLQHRAWLSYQGIPVGPTYYYFGSRHQSQEYLYGEEVEAYIQDGTITKAGLAFSRDGPRKNQGGVFYLCGPTWPVPDVYEALVGALVKNQGHTRESADEFLERLKEEERYVLEVRFTRSFANVTNQHAQVY
ncbi:assimilatory sulfite reductase [Pisolithus marmoratus]|nr:assimilatory sulfite reductase [Pisolithus marmoratus]